MMKDLFFIALGILVVGITALNIANKAKYCVNDRPNENVIKCFILDNGDQTRGLYE